MMTWRELLIAKFPSWNPAWPSEMMVSWLEGFTRLVETALREEDEL